MEIEFQHEDGVIYVLVNGLKLDVTDKVMPLVDDYLDFKIDLKFGTNFSKRTIEKG